MKIDTLEHLVKWSSHVHRQLAEQLQRSESRAAEGTVRLFAEYAITHESRMADQLDGLIDESDRKALGTWVYDWLQHPIKAPDAIVEVGADSLTLTTLGQSLFAAHNEVLRMFRQVQTRADTPEAAELVERVIAIEEGHTRQMAQQLNRTQDM